MSILLGDLGDPACLENGPLSKNSGSNPVTFSGFEEGHLGLLKVWPPGSLNNILLDFLLNRAPSEENGGPNPMNFQFLKETP